tara:strand:+ start:8373 stop:8909 length:537 start_codon:yes stop_codon:yes gene_type:complete
VKIEGSIMEIIVSKDNYSAKEWKDKETDGEDKHRVYIVGPAGEVGYFNVKNNTFHNSPKSSLNFGITTQSESKIILESSNGEITYLGEVNKEVITLNESRKNLQNAIKKFKKMDKDNTKVEINLGPTVELNLRGKSNWAKANITVGAENIENIEELYDIVSEMAAAMLDLEIEKLTNR